MFFNENDWNRIRGSGCREITCENRPVLFDLW